jgi:hypothetical protein
VAVGADDDQACLLLVRRFDDRLPGGRALDRQRRRPESGRLGQRRALPCGLLGGVPDVVGARGIELGTGLWDETDGECAPHREDDRVAPRGQLLAGLGDGVRGEVRAVVGDQDRPGAVGVHPGRTPARMRGQ